MERKLVVYILSCVILFGQDGVQAAFSSSAFVRMFSGYCPPLRNCALRENDCPFGGYAKDVLGCNICQCSTTSTACQGIGCPYGQHCETINRRAEWFSLRNYKCVSDSVYNEIQPPNPLFPLFPSNPRDQTPKPSTQHTTTPATTTTTTTTAKPTRPSLTQTPQTTLSNICPNGIKPGALCNRNNHCKADQTCRIYPKRDYGVCCDSLPTRPMDELHYSFVPRCKQVQDTGPCRSLVPRYFYSQKTGKCERFIFGGCGNNDNNFRNYDECKEKCEDPCHLPRQTGRCRAAMARVFYDVDLNRCSMFYFGGCPSEANGNNWDSFEDCYSHCYDYSRK